MQKNQYQYFATVILPIKFGREISYFLPDNISVDRGSKVIVEFANKEIIGIIDEINHISTEKTTYSPEKNTIKIENDPIEYKIVKGILNTPAISCYELQFWKMISNYYLCTIGEVFKAAYPTFAAKQDITQQATVEQKSTRKRKSLNQDVFTPISEIIPPTLSSAQQQIADSIESEFSQKNRVSLLKGVTGSGKTEIYINLIFKALLNNKSALFMVPEIALSKELSKRLKQIFGERLLIFHSKQTAATKTQIYNLLTSNRHTPTIVLGTRSALFLPHKNLGLIIVDEEHDASYKQSEPAPRYHGRDAAIMLGTLYHSNVLLGTATPSFESEYNCSISKFAKFELNEKFYGGSEPEVDIINTIQARKLGQMKGSFSQKLINQIRKTIEADEQVLIFRNRRSYSPIVECIECGSIPKCPHCNVYFSYHKYNNTLRCHYCEHQINFNTLCSACRTNSLQHKGAGTEKIEEELKILFPNKSVSRYDADIAKSKRTEEQVIKDFAQGNTDILVGTQMISKGFDFEKLGLVVVLQAETILGVQDFRADERAIQLLSQLMGRSGRRGKRGKISVQCNIAKHPVFERLKELSNSNYQAPLQTSTHINKLLVERREFDFPPFVRLIKITAKHTNKEKLAQLCDKISGLKIECLEFTGPFSPAIDKVRGEYLKCFYIKFARDTKLEERKRVLYNALQEISKGREVILDVDPI